MDGDAKAVKGKSTDGVWCYLCLPAKRARFGAAKASKKAWKKERYSTRGAVDIW